MESIEKISNLIEATAYLEGIQKEEKEAINNLDKIHSIDIDHSDDLKAIEKEITMKSYDIEKDLIDKKIQSLKAVTDAISKISSHGSKTSVIARSIIASLALESKKSK